MNKFLLFVWSRAKEASTWAAISAVSAALAQYYPDLVPVSVTAGAIAAAIKEQGATT